MAKRRNQRRKAMTYKLPEPLYFVTRNHADHPLHPIYNPYYTADQMQAAHAAGRKEALEEAAKDGMVLVPLVPTYQMMAKALVACPVFGLSINAMYPMYEAIVKEAIRSMK
jgi:hypothetical protein